MFGCNDTQTVPIYSYLQVVFFYEVCLKAFPNVIYALRKVNRYEFANDISNVSLTISLYLLVSKISVTLPQEFFLNSSQIQKCFI